MKCDCEFCDLKSIFYATIEPTEVEVYCASRDERSVAQKEIAQLVGMSIENVIRAISDLRKDKIIKAYGKNIMIEDMSRLIQIRNHS